MASRRFLTFSLSAELIGVILLFGGSAAAAEPVGEIRVSLFETERLVCQGAVRAKPICEGSECLRFQEQEHTLNGSDSYVFALSPDIGWDLGLDSDHCWSPRLKVLSQSGAEHVTLPLFRSGTVIANGKVRKGELPSTIDVYLTSLHDPLVPQNEKVSCTTNEQNQIFCRLPRVELDLKFWLPEYAPAYVWNVLPASKPIEIGALSFERGGSITGAVTQEGTDAGFYADSGNVLVRLFPFTPPRSPSGQRVPLAATRPTKRGYFQFTGLADGEFELEATARGASPARANVVIDNAKEVSIGEPLTLLPLGRIDVLVEPPTDYAEEVWRIRLELREWTSRYLKTIDESPVSVDGRWHRTDLQHGSYRISILSPDGSVYERRDIVVDDRSSAPLIVSVSRIPIEGKVTAGSEPMSARLTFLNGGSSISMNSDEDGFFSGALPKEGRWRVQVGLEGRRSVLRARAVEVLKTISGTPRWIDIELPGGKLSGTVIDEEGTPVEATVRLTREGALVAEVLATKGKFDITGVEEGLTTVEATARDYESAPTNYRVTSAPLHATIVLSRIRKVQGWIASPDGQPQPGTVIRYFSSSFVGRKEAVAGPSGQFELLIPPKSSIELLVLPPRLPARLISLDSSVRSPLTLVVGGASGTLAIEWGEVPPWPMIRHGGQAVDLRNFFIPQQGGPPRGLSPHGYDAWLETGQYQVCGGHTAWSCVNQTVVHGSRSVVRLPGSEDLQN